MATKVESTESLRRASEWGASKASTLIDEFRKFALKGNVVDLAVGVIIGGAFAKIVDSLVKHLLMPSLSLLFPSDQGYLGWKFAVGNKEIPYGLFLGEVVNFMIVAFALFLFAVKFLGWLSRRQKEAEAVPPAPSAQEQLLVEIRDLLKAQASQK